MDKFTHGGNIEEIGREFNIDASKIIDFSANINPIGLNQNVKNAMINSINKVERYPDIKYFDLKDAISLYDNVNFNDIVLGNGASEVIFNVVRAICPKKVLIFAPTFSEYKQASLSVNAEIKYFYLNETNDFKLNKKYSIDHDIDIIFLCNPNNPTGVLTKTEIIESICQKTNAIIVIDESFLDFVKEDYSCKHLIDKYKNIVIIKSLTKFFAIAGIRVGYGICKNKEIINKINKVTVPWSINTVAVDGVIAALKEKEYINNTIHYIKNESYYLFHQLKKIKELKIFKPSVNFIMFKLLLDIDLKNELLKYNILIRDCSNYDGLGKNFFRVSVRMRQENNKLIYALQDILTKFK